MSGEGFQIDGVMVRSAVGSSANDINFAFEELQVARASHFSVFCQCPNSWQISLHVSRIMMLDDGPISADVE